MRGVGACIIAGVFVSPFAKGSDVVSCHQDSGRQLARSEELQRIVGADQADRKDQDRFFRDAKFRNRVLLRDLERRKRVGEIFGEGCFKEARDFAASALVYQHGDIPEHFFQAFIWSKRAIDLGADSQKELMGKALDRYLVNIGQRQLIATQATKAMGAKCWCLEQVEATFPDERRLANGHRSLSQALDWISELNKDEPSCSEPKPCEDKALKPTPSGFVPGFW
jgi:hypothetical protein